MIFGTLTNGIITKEFRWIIIPIITLFQAQTNILLINRWVYGDGPISFTAPNGFNIGTVAYEFFAYYSTITGVGENDIKLNETIIIDF